MIRINESRHHRLEDPPKYSDVVDYFHILGVYFGLFLEKEKKSFFIRLLNNYSMKRVQISSTYVYVVKYSIFFCCF